MSVLTRCSKAITLSVLITGLAACDRGSSAYRHIKDLPHSQWDRYAASLPVEQRLDLHKEIMERSKHNPLMTISESFTADPKETYIDLVKRIKTGDQSRFYVYVIYSIDRSEKFSICDQTDRKIIQNYLWNMATDAVKDRHRPDFYSC